MSPLHKPVIIDNDVISTLFLAGALKEVLSVWPIDSFYLTARVKDEARRWKTRGQELVNILEELEKKGVITIISIDDTSEEEITAYTRLRIGKKLGEGESASIAIANNRGFNIATDDGGARDACKELYPSIKAIGSGTLLNLAVKDGLIRRNEASQIRKAMDQLFL